MRVDLERIGSSIRRIAPMRFASTALTDCKGGTPVISTARTPANLARPTLRPGIVSFEAGK
jgi:hypothetical protein